MSGPCCAHTRVEYAPDRGAFGIRDRWRCLDCATQFAPAHWAELDNSELVALRDRLRQAEAEIERQKALAACWEERLQVIAEQRDAEIERLRSDVAEADRLADDYRAEVEALRAEKAELERDLIWVIRRAYHLHEKAFVSYRDRVGIKTDGTDTDLFAAVRRGRVGG